MTFFTSTNQKAGLLAIATLLLILAFITGCETEEPIETFSASITISSGSTAIAEDAGNVTITLALSQENSTGASIGASYSIAGTATNGSDFSGLSGNISIPSGSRNATATLSIVDDDVMEGEETIILSLDDASLPEDISLGNSTELTLTIQDNDAITVSVAATDESAKEGDNNAEFTINLSAANSTGETVTINYNLQGTATNGEDYTTLNGEATFEPDATTATISVEVIDDEAVEGSETLIVRIPNNGLPEGFELGAREATITIEDNDEESFAAQASITATDNAASEEGDNASFQVSLDKTNDTGAAITLSYNISGTATNGEDYTSLSGSVEIADGESNADITLEIIDDETVEDEETVILTLSTENLPEGISLADNSEATATITDNDEEAFTAQASITATDDTASEAGDNASFQVSLDKANDTGAAITLSYSISGTAINGEDYTTLSGSVSIANGESTTDIALEIIDDETVEAEETVILTLSTDHLPEGISLADNSAATATISDNDEMSFAAEASIAVSDSEVTEGGSTTFTFSLDKENDTGADLSLQYGISGTSSNGDDFAEINGSISIANGESTATLTISFTDDSEVEDSETLTLTLGTDNQPEGITISSNSSATVTITDNDEAFTATASASASDADASEDGDNGTILISLDQANASGETITLGYTLSGTATGGSDYTSLSGSVSIADGASSAEVAIAPVDDSEVEETETVILTLSSDNLPEGISISANAQSATVNITDNDESFSAEVSVSATDSQATEGSDDGAFTISLDKENTSGGTLSIAYSLSGTATNGTDYTSLSGSVDIAEGASSAEITVATIDDSEAEEAETVILTLSGDNLPEGISISANAESATVTITDNDESFSAAVSISSTDSQATEGSDDASFTISLDKENTSGGTLSIPYSLSGNAVAGTDYASLSGSVDIAEGSTSATVTIDVTDDTEDEEDETVIISLNTDNLPEGTTAGSSTSVTITIVDDDETAFTAEASISTNTSTAQEGSSGLSFTITLNNSNTSGAALTIPYTVSGTASSGSDFTALGGSVEIAENSSSADISVSVIDDSEAELDETLIITLGTLPNGVSASSSTEATGVIEDNESIDITFGTNTGNSIVINSWTSVLGADGYVIVMNSSNSFTDPTAGSYSPASTSYRGYDQQVIFDGTSITSLDLSLLAAGQSYYFKVYPYSGNRSYVTDYTEDSSESTACTTTSTSENEVCWSISGDERTITSNQYPDHETGSFPNADVTATSLERTLDLTPSLSGSTVYVYDETGPPTPSNKNFYTFGVASNGLGFNPMGLKPFSIVDSNNDQTGEENWEWQSKVTDEGETHLDEFGAHVTSQGKYHYHGDTKALASGEDGSKHSIIYGFAADGFPIYYKYGFTSDSDFTSSVKELKSSYQLRSGSRPGDGLTAPDGSYDGTYIQDYEFVDGLGDLDECNGRFGVTPEFPNGTYYYVITGDFPKVPNCFKGTPSTEFLIGN